MRKLAIIPFAVCLALLAALIMVTTPARVIAALKDVSPGHILAAFIAVQFQIIASAYRWRFTAQRMGHEFSLSLAIREYYVSSVLNLLLPGGMAGDALRAYRSRTTQSGGWKRPAAAVFLERLSGQLVFFSLSFVSLLAWPAFLGERLPANFGIIDWLLPILLTVGLGLGFTMRGRKLPQSFREIGPDLAAVFWRRGAWLVQAGLSTLIIGGYVVTFLIASHAVGAPLPAIAAVTVIPLCLMTMLIPISVGGWGTREAAAAALWPLFGFTSAQGLAASLTYGLFSLIGAAIPGLVFVAIAFYKRRPGRA